MAFTALDFEVITYPDGQALVKRSDGAWIPRDPRNSDYQEFLKVEKADEKQEIVRTTITEPEPVKTVEEDLLERVVALETELATVKVDLKAVTDIKTL
jgi:hypothetical protein